MAAEGLIDFDELRMRLSTLEDTRKTAEEELYARSVAQSTWRNWNAIETASWRAMPTSCLKRLKLWNQTSAAGCIE